MAMYAATVGPVFDAVGSQSWAKKLLLRVFVRFARRKRCNGGG